MYFLWITLLSKDKACSTMGQVSLGCMVIFHKIGPNCTSNQGCICYASYSLCYYFTKLITGRILKNDSNYHDKNYESPPTSGLLLLSPDHQITNFLSLILKKIVFMRTVQIKLHSKHLHQGIPRSCESNKQVFIPSFSVKIAFAYPLI